MDAGLFYRVTSPTIEKEGGENDVFGPPFEEIDWQQSSFTYTATETIEHVLWIWTGPSVLADQYIDTVSIRLEE